MFHHGACYLERGGPAEGAIELTFRRHEMNDALRSLAVWVASGNARVQAVTFDSPEPADDALRQRNLRLGVEHTLENWLGALRGRAVRVSRASGSLEGRVLGVERGSRLLVATGAGSIAVVGLDDIQGVEALDPQSLLDLDFSLDRGRAAASGDRRTVRVSITGRADDLRLACVIPSQPWRLSYRVLRQAEATLLVGWALVHNPLDEDLDDLELTLSSSRPSSFQSDLYEGREAVQMVADDDLLPPAVVAPVAPTIHEDGPRASGTIVLDREGAIGPGVGTTSLATSTSGPMPEARPEPFDYRVPHRVSLRRGASALVPVVASSVNARLERVWREPHGPHPDLSLTFANTTLAVLEEGPAVIYNQGAFVGEALVPFTARGDEVRLLYARESSIRCQRSSRSVVSVLGVRLGPGSILEEQQREEVHTFTIDSDLLEEVDVVVARPRVDRRTALADGAVLDEGAAELRLRLRAPAQGRVEATLTERWRDARRIDYDQLTPSELGGWLEARLVDRSTHDALASVLASWAQAASLEEQRGRLEREQHDAQARHAKLREQVAVLGESGQEGAIRLRFVKDMEREQDRVVACENELRKVRDAEAQTRRRAAQTLGVLTAHADRLRTT